MNLNGQSINPYAPPLDADTNTVLEVISDVNVIAQCPRRHWASRTLILTGGLEGELTYRAWTIGESVLLNGKKIARAKGNYITAVCPRIDFALPIGNEIVAAAILAKASYFQLLRIIEFQLLIAGRVVYNECG